jgi:Domain of unknown function (DUF397)
MDLSQARWRTSSRSGDDGGMCVEVATNLPDAVAVRDSKNPGGPTLILTRDNWTAFLNSMRKKPDPT